ncbi:Solute carrier family 23 member 2 [Holothuria leucospilota]|uniref:Solute carrier family 23 member 2 n=1 Tax=Holothuria leucospilota TaxID=206669 RepID=A0A9Q1C6S4_HOLLE|nr:Solute carrier family 23 member 2 [Holothuria leucospilota]
MAETETTANNHFLMAEEGISTEDKKVHGNNNTSGPRPVREKLIYGVEDRPPWPTIFLMGIQHFSISFSGCFAVPLVIAKPLCFDVDRELLNQLLGTSFFVAGITTFLQSFLGTRLPIIQGCSASFIIPVFVLFGLQGPCPPPINSNSTIEERQFVKEVAYGRMQQIQGSICVASLAQVLLGFTGLVGLLLRFIRPITITTTLLLISIEILPWASDSCGTHWGISSLCIFLVTLFSQFLNKYDIPLPRGNKLAVFTMVIIRNYCPFQVLLSVVITWILCLILTAAGAFPDDPSEYGYKARTDVYSDALRESAWFRFPYPGQFGVPKVSIAGFVGILGGVMASVVESLGDYHACAFISNTPPPPVHAINRGVAMEGLGCIAAGLWGAPSGFTSYSNNISIMSITKVASRVTVYCATGLFVISGMIFKFNAFYSGMPEPIIGGIMATTFGMVASIGFANLAFIKVDSSRNLFILGIALFLGIGIPDFLVKNPGAINTGSTVVDQVLNVILGSGMFIGGVGACILDNIVPGTADEKGLNWRKEMAGLVDDDVDDKDEEDKKLRCYDLPFGMNWIRRTHWMRCFPLSPTFVGFRTKFISLNNQI